MSVLKKYNSITSQWDSIVVGSSGPQGAQGAQGSNGAQGAQGPQGAPGATVVTSTTRPSSPTTGQIIFETDTNRIAVWTGSAWVYETASAGPPGLVFITGASFSGVTSVSLPNNTFTSAFDNYKIFFTVSLFSGSSSLSMRMRTNGTDNTADAYRWSGYRQYSAGGGGNNNGDAGNTQFLQLTEANTETAHGEITIFRPLNVSAVKSMNATFTYNRTNSPYWGWSAYGGSINSSNAFDSATFISSSGNFAGNYRVYGMTSS